MMLVDLALNLAMLKHDLDRLKSQNVVEANGQGVVEEEVAGEQVEEEEEEEEEEDLMMRTRSRRYRKRIRR